MKKLKLGLPKGSLQEATLKVFERAGFKIYVSSRSYFPSIDDKEINPVLLRAQEMSRYVEDGTLDAGITGKDWTLENSSSVHVVSDFIYSKTSMRPTRWVLVVANDSPITRLEDLNGKRIATEMVRYTTKYFQERGIKVDQRGGAACHEGYRSCFFRHRVGSGWQVEGERLFDPAAVYGKSK